MQTAWNGHNGQPAGEDSGNTLISVATLLLVLLICVVGPLLAMQDLGPWAGVAGAVVAFPGWAVVSPPPYRGSCGGIVTTAGYGAIFLSLLYCLAKAVGLLFGG